MDGATAGAARVKVSLDCIVFGLQRVGGISTYWSELARWLAAQEDVELALTLPHRMVAEPGAAVAALAPGGIRPALPDRLGRYLAAPVPRDADIVHSSYYRLPPARCRAKRIVTVYDFTYEHYRGGPARWLHSAQKAGAVRGADGVICISETTRNDLLAIYPDVDPARVVAVPLAVARTTFFPVAAAERRADLADCALFVGARAGYKRLDLAVAGVAATPQLRLALVGSAPRGDERAMLDARLPGRWVALGQLDDAALRQAYGSAFALVYPSDHEGFGLPVLEAMACGCPAIVASRPASREVGGSAALYAEAQSGEAYAAALATAGQQRDAAIGSGLHHADTFSWDRTFAATVAFYRQIGG